MTTGEPVADPYRHHPFCQYRREGAECTCTEGRDADAHSVLVRFSGKEAFEHMAQRPPHHVEVQWGEPDDAGAYSPAVFIRYQEDDEEQRSGLILWMAGMALLAAGALCFLAGRWTA